MKVKKLNTKKAGVLHPDLAGLIENIKECGDDSLSQRLRELLPYNTPWQYPRGDMHHWVPVLDKFDAILENKIGEYDVSNVQVKEFNDEDKALILEILRVEKLIMDNATSRKIFASYDRLSDLMSTSDLDVLQSVLNLVHRPAQQYSSVSTFELSENAEVQGKLLLLATAGGDWGRLKEHGWGLVRLAQAVSTKGESSEAGSVISLPDSFFNVHAQFYRPTQISASGEPQISPETPDTKQLLQPTSELRLGSQEQLPSTPSAQSEDRAANVLETPTKRSAAPSAGPKGRLATLANAEPSSPQPAQSGSSSGIVTVTKTAWSHAYTNQDGLTKLSLYSSAFADLARSGKYTPHQVLAELLKEHPELQGADMKDVHFEILSRLQCMLAVATPDGKLSPGDKQRIAKVLTIRLTALAIYFHIVREDVAQTDLFLHEPTIISQLAQLIQPSSRVDDSLVTAAILTDDACLRYRTKATEVFSSLNANVAHGILMTFFRDLIKRLAADEDVPYPLVDATLSLLSLAVVAPSHGNMLVGAGIIPTLIKLIKDTNPKHGGYVARAIGLVDTIIYSGHNVFGIFCNAGGLDMLNSRITLELDRWLAPSAMEENITESELQRRTVPLKLMFRSIHRLMQSGGTAEGLRNLIDSELPKSLLRTLHNANKLGAPVLAIAINITATFVHNEPTSLPVIQELKLPEAMYDALENNKYPSYEVISTIPYALGALCLNQVGMDYALSRPELIKLLVNSPRNPAYRDVLKERDNAAYLGSSLDELVRHHPALKTVLHEAIFSMLHDLASMGQHGRWANIAKAADYKLLLDAAQAGNSTSADMREWTDLQEPSESDERNMDVVLWLSSQLLSGLFHNPHLAKDFLAKGGLHLVLELYKLPCLVIQFATTDTANHFHEVFRNLAEADLPKVLEGIVSAAKEAMIDIPALEWHDGGVDTVASTRMLHPGSPDDLEKANIEFRKIVHLNNVLGLLSSLYSTIGFTHGKVATTFLMALGAFDGTPFIANLGKLHRASIWQNIWLKAKQSPTKIKPHAITQLQTFEETILSPGVEFSASELENPAQSTPVSASLEDESTRNDASAKGSTSATSQKSLPENYASLQYLFTRIPLQLTSFFQGVVKMLLFRRVEPVHKVQAVPTANCLADMLVEHLKLHNESAPSATEVASKAAIMSLVSLLLFDGWTTTLSVNTMLLVAFEKKGGITAIKRLLVQHVDSLGTQPLAQSSQFQQDKPGLLRLLASLKVTFDLVKTLVSASPLCESSQTAILTTKDKEPDHEDYFSPYEFLIKLRLDLADPIWKAFTSVWLVECPITFVKTITKSALTLVEPIPAAPVASGSVPPPSSSSSLSSTLAGLGFPTSRAGATASPSELRPDPYYTDMLVDMGFSRYAAELSLQRTNNILPSATHYIVQHGHQLIAPGETMSIGEAPIESVSGNIDGASGDAQNDRTTSQPVTSASSSPSSRAKAIAEGRKSHLEQRRKVYRQDVPTRALEIVEVHNDLVFEFAHTLLENPGSIAAITDAINEIEATDASRDAKLQARLRLFVVVAHQPAFGSKLNVNKCSELMETLRKLTSTVVSPRPQWVPALLLAVDCLLMWGEGVKPTVEGETAQSDIYSGPRYESARTEMLSFTTSLLAQPDLNEDELLAILRTLVFLTRDRSLLQPFLEQTGLPGLFQAVLAASTKRRHTAMALATIICRHLIEDEAVLQRCMEREVQQWFAKPPRNNSTATIKLFVSNLRSAVLRDPASFLKVASTELKLVEAEPRGGMHHVALKDKEPSASQKSPVEAEVTTVTQPIETDQMQIDDPFQAMPEPAGTTGSPLEQVMGYLINEVFSIHKAQIAKPTDMEMNPDIKQSPENQLSAILLVMTELLGSYNESKISMLQPSKKTGKDAVGGNKMRSPVLQILLNHYVCNIVFDADVTRSSGDKVTDSQKARMNISNWAGAVIVALCSDASGPGTLKSAPSSIVSIRKTVMDTVAKAIKEVGTATDPLNLRYGRLWALSELCYRLLTARSSVQPRHHDDSSLHIAKIMLEKGFVPLLTNAMAEVDLTYPQVKNLITAIVQPLEYLTKISMKMARPDKPKPAADDSSEDESMSSGTESEDEDMEDEEGSTDAPDMYRNSSLGMFGGEMDDYLDDSDDMGDEDDDDDLDHYEEVEGMDDESENGTEPSESESESDEELEHWDAHMEDVDGAEGDEVFPNEDEDGHDHGGEDQFDMFDEDGVELIDQENDEDGYDGEEVYLEDDMDEEEHSESDYDEEELNALDTVVVDPLSASSNTQGAANWGWGQPVRTQSRDDTNQQHRAHRSLQTTMSLMDDIAPFRRSHTPQPPLSSIVSHPLLQQETASTAHPLVPRSRAHRHYPGGPLGEILHSIEQLMGGSDESARTLDNIMEQMGGRAPEMVRIEYMGEGGSGGALEIPVPRGAHASHSRRGREHAPVEPEAFSSMPLPTLNRWQEEESLLGAYDPTTRLNNLSNHLIQALLPAAKEDQRKRSEREAEAKQAIEAKLEQQRIENEALEEKLRAQREAEEAERQAQEPPTGENVAGNSNSRDVEMNEVDAGTTSQETLQENTAPAERVIVTIHGAQVDITDTGIDPEFLEALPEDMRADVVQQHLREHRMTEAPQQPAMSTEISPEFLDALPPEIRAEVIQQEAMEAARRNAESRAGAASGGPAARVPEMFAGMPEMADIQEFLSTLAPGLSSTLMQTGMAGFGQQAGGGQAQTQMQALHESMARIASATGGASQQPHRGGRAEAPQKKAAPRESIQLLEKSGIAALVRLLFFPDINKKDRLLKVLGNLCENTKSRSDVVNLLLSVLQDDSGDLSYVDKQTLSKPLKGATATPKATPKKKTLPENTTSSAVMLAGLQSDSIPSFVAQRAFEALAHIAANNEQVLVYFLTEHELPVPSAKVSKKGKSKDRQSASTYPITVLLKLLDRETLFRSPGMADTLTALLASLTRPLAAIASTETTNDTAAESQDQVPAQPHQVAVENEQVVTSAAQSSSAPAGAEADPSADNPAKTAEPMAEENLTILKIAPSISEEILRMVPSILTHGECSSRTFSSTLSLIQNLTYIPGAKEIISSQLQDQAQRLGDTLRIDLESLHQGLLQAEGNGGEVSVASFTPASSAQTKLLRVLKTIDYIYAPKDGQNHITWDASAITSIAEGTKALTAEEEKVEGIFEAMHFTPLWDTLGSCLSVVERKDSLINIATVLLPLVESLMVVSKYGSAKAAASRGRVPSAALSPMSPKNAPEEEPFVVFTSRHRKVLNTMVRNNPSLMSGSFSLLILNPRVLEFDNKRNWFMQQLRKKPNRDVGGHIHLNIRRDEVFVDSYRALSNKSGETLKYGKLNIKFAGEEGVDAGGVTREWYSVLAQSIFNPGYCLFEPCAADEGTYQLSQHSWVNGYAQDYFKFIGKIIGKAIYDQRLLDAYFSRAFYKQILGRKVDVRDLESVDPEYHKSLLWMLNNDITGIIELDFSLETEEFGAKKIIDLKEGGSNIPVTEENKEEYVRLVVEHRLETSIQKQASAFLAGFYEVIPRKLISVFDPDQLELLISGVSQIDVDELKNATQLHGWKHSDAEITWFWRALRSFSQEEKAKFLMFVTSSSRVPLGGFTQLQGSSGIQPFQIHKLYRENVLPSSATCFNELLLPSYPSYEDLRHKLLTAISEGAGHFGHA